MYSYMYNVNVYTDVYTYSAEAPAEREVGREKTGGSMLEISIR